jgi:hypothetical protein
MDRTSRLHRALFIGMCAALAAAVHVDAQRARPLAPLPDDGLRVAPFFDGWYENADGSITLSFGYSNLNRNEVIEIPLGPDNVVEPKEYDGKQPTSFPPVRTDSSGARIDRRERERGVFTVTVPAGFKGDVVWTLRYRGQSYRVPGRSKTGAYQLRWPMAMGSVPPLLRFTAGGPTGRGPVGLQSDLLQATVGKPLALTVYFKDDSVREADAVPFKPRGGAAKAAINVTWYKHTGPGAVTFDPAQSGIAELEGQASTSATFDAPGDYVLRVRGDNFGRFDTSPGNQCCWTNGYIRVAVK